MEYRADSAGLLGAERNGTGRVEWKVLRENDLLC